MRALSRGLSIDDARTLSATDPSLRLILKKARPKVRSGPLIRRNRDCGGYRVRLSGGIVDRSKRLASLAEGFHVVTC